MIFMLLDKDIYPVHRFFAYIDYLATGVHTFIHYQHMPTANTSDIVGPSLVGGSVNIAKRLWWFPIYPHTLTMMLSNRSSFQLANVSCTSHVTKH